MSAGDPFRRLAVRLRSRLRPLLEWLLREIVEDTVHRRPYIYGDPGRVAIHPTANVNNALLNTASGRIVVEEHAFFGHGVRVLTGTHEVTRFGADRQQTIPESGRDVIVRTGAWVGSGSTVLGPCVIGEHAVVAAHSLVNRDVPAFTIVGGVPAKPLRTIDPAADE
jgi:acetyltransferase-like isoleucine patch superfamily enzyme